MKPVQLHAINVNLLVALDALLKTSSVTASARRLGVTPSAMSHSLRQLRELLDDPLLVRAQRGLRLTPRAEALAPALSAALSDLERALHQDVVFDPRSAVRRFVVAAPDFLGTAVLQRLTRRIAVDCPGIGLDLLPSSRLGESWRLQSGEIDCVLGAVLEDLPDTRQRPLYEEQFVVIARHDHPDIQGSCSLEQFCRWPHALIGLDDRWIPERSWVYAELASRGLERRVAIRERYFMGVASTVASTDLISPVPHTLARWAEVTFGVQVLAPPLALPRYHELLVWHARSGSDPGHAWLRDALAGAAAELVQETPPPPETPSWEGAMPPVGQD